MDIELKNISVRELTEDFKDNAEKGVTSYKGLLDIRPPYQREFVYNKDQQIAVIDTVMNNFPLNIMYWSDKEDGTYEIIDGQQRTLSICKFISSDFSLGEDGKTFFHSLPDDTREKILDYKLDVYICTGTESEKLKWFETINIAGEELTKQELRNAVYAGPWLNDAKKHFSKTGCPAYQIGNKYLNGSPIRQDYLETVIKWHKDKKETIEEYMSKNQKKSSATDLWRYFQDVITWTNTLFINQRKEMKGLPWGELYNKYEHLSIDPDELEEKIKTLMKDEDVKNKKGIYKYVFDGKEKHLNIRAFSNRQKREAYERQDGICPVCNNHFELKQMEADHITPWSKGGKTIKENCQMLCREDNRTKSNK